MGYLFNMPGVAMDIKFCSVHAALNGDVEPSNFIEKCSTIKNVNHIYTKYSKKISHYIIIMCFITICTLFLSSPLCSAGRRTSSTHTMNSVSVNHACHVCAVLFLTYTEIAINFLTGLFHVHT